MKKTKKLSLDTHRRVSASVASADVPVRRVITRSGRGIRGRYPSRKMGRMVSWESMHELNAIRLFEFNPAVAAYLEQPCTEIYYDEHGKLREFTPDFRVDWVSGECMWVEVKTDDYVAYPPTQKKLAQIAMRMQALNKHYRILKSSEIVQEPRFKNILALESHSRVELKAESIMAIDSLDRRKLYTVEEMAVQIGGLEAVLTALAKNRLRSDLSQQITDQSQVWHPDNREAGDGSFSI